MLALDKECSGFFVFLIFCTFVDLLERLFNIDRSFSGTAEPVRHQKNFNYQTFILRKYLHSNWSNLGEARALVPHRFRGACLWGAHRDTVKGNFFVFWAISKILKPTTKSDEWYHILF